MSSQLPGSYTHIDVLARKPDARVLIVPDGGVERPGLYVDIAEKLFPEWAVVGAVNGGVARVDYFQGREVFIWHNVNGDPEPGQALAASICGGAAKVGIIGGQYPIRIFQNDLPRATAYARQHLKPYRPNGVNGHAVGAPKASDEPGDVSARPVASVTPITEARTREQRKPRVEPSDDYAPFSDDALASSFTAMHPELRYVARWGKWLAWNDAKGWEEDSTLQVYDMARKVVCAVVDETRGATPSQVNSAKSAGKIAAVEKMAKSDRAHAASTEQWDADPMMLNTLGGLVDLGSGTVRPARIEDYCRRITDAAPEYEPATRWLDFLKFGTNGDDDLLDFLQLWAGYSATGETKEQKFVFMHGPGGAGKGTFVNTIARVLGSYARKIAMDTLVDTGKPRDGGAPSEDIAGLAGARMGYAAETEQGRRWNEARLKEITGEDKLRARFMAKDSFEFWPVIKLIIMGNHPPGLKTVGNDMIRRTLIVPFEHLPPAPDGDLREKLWAERNRILGWIISGAVRWRHDGLKVPESVLKRSAAYFENQDIMGQWQTERCELGDFQSTLRTLYQSYRSFCESSHEYALRQGEFRDALMNRPGISQGGYKTAPVIKGLRVRVDDEPTGARSANGYMPD